MPRSDFPVERSFFTSDVLDFTTFDFMNVRIHPILFLMIFHLNIYLGLVGDTGSIKSLWLD